MAKNNHLINSMGAGEVSPHFFGRTDSAQYNQSCEKLVNMITNPLGGVSRRAGTEYMFNVSTVSGDTTGYTKIIPFLGSDGTRWQIVLTGAVPTSLPYSAGVKKWFVINVESGAISALCQVRTGLGSNYETYQESQYYALVTRNGGVPLSAIQHAQSGDTMIVTFGGVVRPIRIIYEPASAGTNGTAFYFYGYPRQLGDATVTSLADFPESYGADPYLLPGEVFADDLVTSIAYDVTSATLPTNLDDGANNNAVLTFTFSGAGALTNDWRGRLIKLSTDGGSPDPSTRAFMIFEIVSSTVAYGRLLNNIGGTTADTANRIEYGAWDDIHGWPKSVCFFEGRLVFGGSETFPNKVWFSEVDDILQFMRRRFEHDADFGTDPFFSLENTSQFQTTLRGDRLSAIRWLSSGKNITCGANDGEFVIQGPDQTQSIGPANIQTNMETAHGCAFTAPVKVDSATAFITSSGSKVRELSFNFNEDNFKADDMNMLAEHISKAANINGELDETDGFFTGFYRMVIQKFPHNILWVRDLNGWFHGLTRDRFQQVAGWHRHRLGGEQLYTVDPGNAASNTLFYPRVLDMSVIARPSLGVGYPEQDEMWMVVIRSVHGGSDLYSLKYFIEKMHLPWDQNAIEDNWSWTAGADIINHQAPVYMDCTVFANSTTYPTGVITGLPHGPGAEVSVLINGQYYGEFTLDSSSRIDVSAVMPDAPWVLICGFNYECYVVPNTPEVPTHSGSSQGYYRRVHELVIHFYRTIAAKFGRVSNMDEEDTPVDAMEAVVFKRGDDEGPYPLYTGDKKVSFPQGYESRPKIKIVGHLPFPMTITHISAKMMVEE